jgi:hypothetical protein
MKDKKMQGDIENEIMFNKIVNETFNRTTCFTSVSVGSIMPIDNSCLTRSVADIDKIILCDASIGIISVSRAIMRRAANICQRVNVNVGGITKTIYPITEHLFEFPNDAALITPFINKRKENEKCSVEI